MWGKQAMMQEMRPLSLPKTSLNVLGALGKGVTIVGEVLERRVTIRGASSCGCT